MNQSGEVMDRMSSLGNQEFSSQGQRKERIDEPRVNRRIRVPEIRLIGDDGEQLGIMPTIQALKRAELANLDLVEVQPRAKPPVCKIMDYGKYKYEQSRKAAEAKKKQQQIELKEVKFRPKTGDHDFDVKVRNLKRFLEQGDKGKVSVVFRGREIVHTDIGFEMLRRVIENLGDAALVEQNPRMEGRQVIMIVAPARNTGKKS
jgi:translation initiation factor IF-3